MTREHPGQHEHHEAHGGHEEHGGRAAPREQAERGPRGAPGAAGAAPQPGLHEHGAVAEAQPYFGRTFLVSVVRSAAIKAGAEMEVLTRNALIRGRPAEASEFRDLWHRTREQIVEERHDPTSRIPEIRDGDFLELVNVTVTPLGSREQGIELDRLLLFTDEIAGIHPISPT